MTYNVFGGTLNPTLLYSWLTLHLGTCEASRFEFESDDSDSILRADSKFLNRLHLSSYHKRHSLFNKNKLQLLRRCN